MVLRPARAAFLPLGTKNGVVIHYTQKTNSPLYLIRGRTTVRVDQETLKATLISYTDSRFNTVFRHVDPMVRPRGGRGGRVTPLLTR